MNILEELLSRVRTKRQERMVTSVERFDSLLTDFVTGREVDADLFSELLDELDIDHAKVHEFAKEKENRLGRIANMKRLQAIADGLGKAEQDASKIKQDIADFIAKKQPLLDAATERVKEARLAADALQSERISLRTSCVPLPVKHRQAALVERQRQWRAERDAYRDICGREVDRLAQLKDAERLSTELIASYALSDSAKDLEQQKLLNIRKEMASLQESIGQYAARKQRLDDLQRELDVESQEIERLLLQP